MAQIFSGNPFKLTLGLLFASPRIRLLFYPFVLAAMALYLLFILLSSVSLFPRQTLRWSYLTPTCSNHDPTILIDIDYDEWAIMNRYVSPNSSITPLVWERLKPAMTTIEKRTMRIILSQIIKVSEAMNFTHFMMSGTLFGSYRHHGLIPWDDDVDILMRYAQRDEILSYFRNYSKEHDISVETSTQQRLKLFHKYRSIPVEGWRYRWPTVDISFYYENSTHIWQRYFKSIYLIIPKSLIFPLHRRPFELLWINSPFDAFGILRLVYKYPSCVTLTWVHRTEQHPRQILEFKCEIVSGFYPFVERHLKDGCVQEDLVLNGKVLYSMVVEEPLYAIAKPYVLQLVTEPDLNLSTKISRRKTRITKETWQAEN